MKSLLPAVKAVAGSLALVGGAMAVVAAIPAGAAGSVQDNFAFGSYAPTGAITSAPNDLAESPPADTEVAYNVNINGLLTTGTTTDTAGAASAYAKVTHVSAHTSWADGANTDTFTIAASQVATYCGSPSSFPANTISGTLTEDSKVTATGVSVSHQVFNLPQLPALGQTYSFGASSIGTVVLNAHQTVNGTTEIRGITVTTPTTPAQTLWIAVVGCTPATGGPGGIVNGNFDSPPSITAPWVTTSVNGSVTVSTGAGPTGDNAADLASGGTNAGSATLSQDFIADGTTLSFVYRQFCTAGAGGLTITLTDHTTATTTDLLNPSPRCSFDSGFQLVTHLLRPGDFYTLTFSNTNTAFHGTITFVAEVAVGLVAPSPPPTPTPTPTGTGTPTS